MRFELFGQSDGFTGRGPNERCARSPDAETKSCIKVRVSKGEHGRCSTGWSTRTRRGWIWLIVGGFVGAVAGIIVLACSRLGPLRCSPLLPQSRSAEIYDLLRRGGPRRRRSVTAFELLLSVPTWGLDRLGRRPGPGRWVVDPAVRHRRSSIAFRRPGCRVMKRDTRWSRAGSCDSGTLRGGTLRAPSAAHARQRAWAFADKPDRPTGSLSVSWIPSGVHNKGDPALSLP